jgi:hypothetical protein
MVSFPAKSAPTRKRAQTHFTARTHTTLPYYLGFNSQIIIQPTRRWVILPPILRGVYLEIIEFDEISAMSKAGTKVW